MESKATANRVSVHLQVQTGDEKVYQVLGMKEQQINRAVGYFGELMMILEDQK